MTPSDKYNMKETNKWTDLGVKEKLAVTSAIIAFLAGWILTGLAAFVPLLISEQGVLWVLGQALIYTASVFGVSAYFGSESRKLKQDVQRMMDEERRKIEESEE